MTDNLNQYNAMGARYLFYSVYHATLPDYIAGVNTALAAGEDSGAGRAIAIKEVTSTTPGAPVLTADGDNGILGTFLGNPTDSPAGGLGFGAFDQDFDVLAMAKTIHAEGPHDLSISSNRCNEYTPIHIVVNSPAMSQVSGSVGESGWQINEYLYTFVQGTSSNSISINTPHEYTHTLAFNERGVTPWGETISNTDYGVTQGWKFDPYWSSHPVYYHVYRGDGGAAQTFTLDQIPYADDGTALQIWDNGTKLVHTTDYTVSTTTGLVTFVSTDPAAGNMAVCKVVFNPSC